MLLLFHHPCTVSAGLGRLGPMRVLHMWSSALCRVSCLFFHFGEASLQCLYVPFKEPILTVDTAGN